AAGLDLSLKADRDLLTSRIDSAAVVARGFQLPYAGFAGSNTLAQALRSYPQFNASLAARNASLGRSWYDSLQIKATQRFNRGVGESGSRQVRRRGGGLLQLPHAASSG